MAGIGWNESNPPDTESAGLGDDRIRSLTTSIRVGMDDEHVWPSGGGDAGKHRLGSTRVYYGPESAVSSAGTDGKLMVTSDTSRLFHVGSGGTSYLGGSRLVSIGTDQGFTYPQRHHWVEEVGTGITGASGNTIVTIPSSGFSGMPYVSVTGWAPDSPTNGQLVINYPVTLVTATNFTVYSQGDSSVASGASFFWRSLGTRVL